MVKRWNQSEVIEARRLILEAAKGVLSGAISPIEGARNIARTRFDARLESDPDILRFVGIDSETDALPIGTDRIYWQTQALAQLQGEIDKSQAWAREVATAYCQSLLERSASLLQWPT